MEVPEQEFSVAFSQMLKMFPNIPHDIIWMYVQRYSSDVNKCSQMLNLLHTKYADIQMSPSANSTSLTEDLQTSPFSNPIEIPYDSSDTYFTKSALFINPTTTTDILNQNIDRNKAMPQHPISAVNDQEKVDGSVLQNNINVDNSKNFNRPINFHEPLELSINVDDDNDSLHSWRPNISSSLCPDFFLPSPTVEDFQMNKNNVSDSALECNVSQVQMNPECLQQKSSHNGLFGDMLYGYLPQNENYYFIDYKSHLHFQKSQMNAIRFEVIKARIELTEVQESVEKLQLELEEKVKIDNIQDIEKFNEEIVQLRLECQCLCTEVDYYTPDNNVPLGEIDEMCYSNHKRSVAEKSEDPVENECQHSGSAHHNNTEEVQLWSCSKCTFDNQPARNDCAMCHSTRSTKKPPYLRIPPDECYCHPKKGSPPIFS